MTITFYNWTVFPLIFTRMYECFLFLFHKRRQPPSSLTTPFAGSNTMRFLSLGVRWRQRLRTTTAHVPQGTSWSDNTCTADHYSGHAIPSLGWIWLLCGCVSCDPGCTHWRIVINAWETWKVAAADGVRCARVRWEINFLLTFETAPFFCVYPVYIYIYIYISCKGIIWSHIQWHLKLVKIKMTEF